MKQQCGGGGLSQLAILTLFASLIITLRVHKPVSEEMRQSEGRRDFTDAPPSKPERAKHTAALYFFFPQALATGRRSSSSLSPQSP
jgi:hypothetical protein